MGSTIPKKDMAIIGNIKRHGFLYLFILTWLLTVVGPLLFTAVLSFWSIKNYSIAATWTLETWRTFIDTGLWRNLGRTITFAIIITCIELLFAYPLAFWLSKRCKNTAKKVAILTLLTVPFFLSETSRTIPWISLLGTHGVVNDLLLAIRLIDQPLPWLLYSPFAVIIGLLPLYYATMVFPIYLSLSLLDDRILEASADLGATNWQTLRLVIFPLSAPGVAGGILLTFGPILGAWVVPTMLGGGFANFTSNAIQGAFSSSNYPLMSAMSVALLVCVTFLLGATVIISRKYRTN